MSSHAKRVKAHYDKLAPSYETSWPAYNQIQIEWIKQRWPKHDAHHDILDLGCGSGLMLDQAAELSPHASLKGIDVSSGMLANAKARLPNADFIEGNLEDPSIANALLPADISLSLSILHHLTDTDGYLRLLDKVTRPGGTVFLSAFAKDGLAMHLREHLFRATQPYHTGTYVPAALAQKIEAVFGQGSYQSEILHPDRFWRIQIYAISKA